MATRRRPVRGLRRTQAEIRKSLVELQRSMRDGVTLGEVMTRFRVKRSRAIELMNEAAALVNTTVVSSGRGPSRVYRCDDADPFRLELSESEVLPALVLLRDAPTPLFGNAMRQAERISDRLPAALDAATAKRIRTVANRIRLRFQPTQSAAEDAFSIIVNAVADHSTIRFGYATAENLPTLASRADQDRMMTPREVEPWAVFFAKRHLYVIAKPVGDSARASTTIDRFSTLRTFKLTRMRNVRATETRFRVPAWFDLDAYLADSWEVVRFGSKPKSKVVIDLAPLAAENLLDTTWHPSQKVERDSKGRIRLTDNGMVRISFRLRGYDEIKYWVLGLGSLARVVKPEALRRAVLNEIEGMRKHYR